MSNRTLKTAAAASAAVGAVIAVAASGVATAAPVASTAATPALTVYQGAQRNAVRVLGPQFAPTLVVRTSPVPAGRYLITYSVGTVIGPNDNVVCAAVSSDDPNTNYGLFGSAGNGSLTSGSGPAGIYGDAVETDIVNVTRTGSRINVTCNAGNPSRGTYVSGASITALPITRAVVNG